MAIPSDTPPTIQPPASPTQERKRGFISYAHIDGGHFDEFQVHMRGIQRRFPWLDVDADTALRPGHEWEEAILNMIANAHMFILLISPEFIASDFIMDKELPAMRARRQQVGALLLPVVLSQCSWPYVCGAVQAVPRNDKVLKPIDEWETPRKGFVQAQAEIAAEIEKHFGVPMQFFDWSAK